MYVERIPNRNFRPPSFCARAIVMAIKSENKRAPILRSSKHPRALRHERGAADNPDALIVLRCLPHGYVVAAVERCARSGFNHCHSAVSECRYMLSKLASSSESCDRSRKAQSSVLTRAIPFPLTATFSPFVRWLPRHWPQGSGTIFQLAGPPESRYFKSHPS
jgi:hypothetical protein